MKNLGDRMKSNYENAYRFKLTRRTPVIIRLDGKAFHTLTRGCKRPFDDNLHTAMVQTMSVLCEHIQGVKCAYTQSDEISLLLLDTDTLDTGAWFDNNLQKLVSVSASMASVYFNMFWRQTKFNYGFFDSRAFNVPTEEVKNYFIWRQKDWERNSLQMLAQSEFSHKELHKKNKEAMHEMLHEKGINWADLEPRWKNGTFIFRDKSKWKALTNLVLTRDERPVVGSLFDYILWHRDKQPEHLQMDVFKLET
jgi:tRNA(His) 5'-end guanylyltransferase